MIPIANIVKGDNIDFECTIAENITNWKIRCEVYDGGTPIKKATANSGGSDDQIEITDVINGKFTIKILKGETKDFNREANIEIECETNEDKIFTVYQNTIIFLPEKIDWVTP